jgi:4'-phosphopantetheinyl transferase EntD
MDRSPCSGRCAFLPALSSLKRSTGKQRPLALWHSVKVNDAKISPTLSSLFPAGVLAAELSEPGNPESLFPEEARLVAKAVAKRVQEFSAGRACARLTMAEFGIRDFPLMMADDRQPLWPAELVGSITHTEGFCAAAAARKHDVAAIGMDCEVAGSVKSELWSAICTSCETEWLLSLPSSEQGNAATLIFCAKEAFYKCQYPLVRERLGFCDARVEVLDWGRERGAYRIHACRNIAISRHAELPAAGRYLFHDAFVTAAIAMV